MLHGKFKEKDGKRKRSQRKADRLSRSESELQEVREKERLREQHYLAKKKTVAVKTVEDLKSECRMKNCIVTMNRTRRNYKKKDK